MIHLCEFASVCVCEMGGGGGQGPASEGRERGQGGRPGREGTQ